MIDLYIPLIADVVACVIILIFTLRGRKRGLIKTLAGIAAIILAFVCAGQLAARMTPYVSSKYITPKVVSALLPEGGSAPKDSESVSNALLDLKIPESVISEAITDFSDSIGRGVSGSLYNLSESISYKVTYAVLFVICFILLLIILTILFKVVNIFARVPGINFVNKTLGLVLGLVFGFLTVSALAFILIHLDLLISEDVLSKTYVLKFVTQFNPLSLLSAYKPA